MKYDTNVWLTRWAWALVLAATLYTRFHPILFAANLGISLVMAIVAFAGLCRSGFGKRFAKGLVKGRLLAILAPIVWYGFLELNLHHSWVETVEIRLHSNKFASCAASGIAVDAGQRLSVCEIDNRWWRYGFTKAIVYDSSRQVALAHPHRTRAWELATRRIVEVPFGTVGYSVSPLGGNYYALFFQDDELPDF